MPSDSKLIQHYTQFWGEPTGTIVYQDIGTIGLTVLVLEFEPEAEEEDWVYATVGASRQSMPRPIDMIYGQSGERMELFLYSRQRNDELADLLSRLAVYPFEFKTFFASGHVIPGNQPITGESVMTDLLLIRPLSEPPEFEIIGLADSSHIQILWVIPIHSTERIYIHEHGWEALEALFYDHQTDTSDLLRNPVV